MKPSNLHNILTRYCLAIAFSAIAITNMHAEQKQALTLQMRQGAEIVYFLESQPQISFAGQTMIVATADNASREIPMEDVERWTVGMREYATINDITADTNLRIAISSGEVRISNHSGSRVAIYSTDGRLIDSAEGDTMSFTLPHGLYIITANDQSYKILIR